MNKLKNNLKENSYLIIILCFLFIMVGNCNKRSRYGQLKKTVIQQNDSLKTKIEGTNKKIDSLNFLVKSLIDLNSTTKQLKELEEKINKKQNPTIYNQITIPKTDKK